MNASVLQCVIDGTTADEEKHCQEHAEGDHELFLGVTGEDNEDVSLLARRAGEGFEQFFRGGSPHAAAARALGPDGTVELRE